MGGQVIIIIINVISHLLYKTVHACELNRLDLAPPSCSKKRSSNMALEMLCQTLYSSSIWIGSTCTVQLLYRNDVELILGG